MAQNFSFEDIVVTDYAHDNGVTVVRVAVCDDLGIVDEFVGTAQKHPDDKNDPSLGYCIAYGRAVAKVAKKIEKVVASEVAQADHEREHAKKIAAERSKFREFYNEMTELDIGKCDSETCLCKADFDTWYVASKKRLARIKF